MKEELAKVIADWIYDRPGVNLRLEYNINELASAVYFFISPVPNDVRVVKDREGDEWRRDYNGDSDVWRFGDITATLPWVNRNYGPVTW